MSHVHLQVHIKAEDTVSNRGGVHEVAANGSVNITLPTSSSQMVVIVFDSPLDAERWLTHMSTLVRRIGD